MKLRKFDYLDDNAAKAARLVANARLPRYLHAPSAAAVIVSCIAFGITTFQVRIDSKAGDALREQTARVDRTQRALTAVQLEASSVEEMIARERRLHDLRSSGARLARRLAAFGNVTPDDATFTSVRADGKGYTIEGTAPTLSVISAALAGVAALPGAPRLASVVRSNESSPAPLTFQIESGEPE